MHQAEYLRVLLFLTCFCLPCAAGAKDVYKIVDESGNVIYSDTPAPGAEKIEIYDVQTIDPGDVPEFVYTPPVREVAPYNKLEILSPVNGTVIRSHEGNINISAIVDPAVNIREGHSLVLYLDGVIVASGTYPQFDLSGVEQGSHSTSIVVMNRDGSEIIQSALVSFTVQRETLVEPASDNRQMPMAEEAASPEVINEKGPRGFAPRGMPTVQERTDPEWIKKYGPHGFAPRQTPPAPPPGPQDAPPPAPPAQPPEPPATPPPQDDAPPPQE